MPKRTLEEIHEFNQRLKEKDDIEREKRWQKWREEWKKPKNMKREAARKRYQSNTQLRVLNQFKEVLEHKCTLDDFIKNRCYCKRYPNIEFLHNDARLVQEDHCKGYLNSVIRELENRELFIGFIEFLSNKTKPFIHKTNTAKQKLEVQTYDISQRYGLIVMYYDDEGKFSRFILKVNINEDHRVTQLDFIHGDAGIYNYVLCKDLKLPPERKKVTHYMEGMHYLFRLSNGGTFSFSSGLSKMSADEAITHAEENITRYRIDLDKKPRIIARHCPICNGYMERYGEEGEAMYKCLTCKHVEYQDNHPDEPIMKCPECGEGDAVLCYKWNKKKKKSVRYIGCTNAPGCTLHLRVKEK